MTSKISLPSEFINRFLGIHFEAKRGADKSLLNSSLDKTLVDAYDVLHNAGANEYQIGEQLRLGLEIACREGRLKYTSNRRGFDNLRSIDFVLSMGTVPREIEHRGGLCRFDIMTDDEILKYFKDVSESIEHGSDKQYKACVRSDLEYLQSVSRIPQAYVEWAKQTLDGK